jgi:hypothetical protein
MSIDASVSGQIGRRRGRQLCRGGVAGQGTAVGGENERCFTLLDMLTRKIEKLRASGATWTVKGRK